MQMLAVTNEVKFILVVIVIVSFKTANSFVPLIHIITATNINNFKVPIITITFIIILNSALAND
jgi:hypothetical protein